MGNTILSLCPEPPSKDIKSVTVEEVAPFIEEIELSSDKVEYKDNETLFNEKLEKALSIMKESRYTILLLGENFTKPDQFVDLNLSSNYQMIPLPTNVHKSITKLYNSGILKHIITSNQDTVLNFTLKKENFTELHGNYCTEQCDTCNKIYYRHFDVRTGNQRLCELLDCKGKLKQCSYLKHGDQINQDDYNIAIHHLEKADAILCLGAFLTKPMATFVEKYKEKNQDLRIIIIHPLKSYRNMDIVAKKGGTRIFDSSDYFLKKLFEHLNYENEKFEYDLERYKKENNIVELEVSGKSGLFNSSLLSDSVSDVVEIFRSSLQRERNSLTKERNSLPKERNSLPKEKLLIETPEKRSSSVDPKETQNLIKKLSD